VLGAAEGVSYLVVGGVLAWSLARRLSSGSGECLVVVKLITFGHLLVMQFKAWPLVGRIDLLGPCQPAG
jgi:hypothetical protein